MITGIVSVLRVSTEILVGALARPAHAAGSRVGS